MMQRVFVEDLDDRAPAGPSLSADRAAHMRIGMVCPYSFDVPGGVQFHVRDLAEYFLAQGHEASACSRPPTTTPRCRTTSWPPAARSPSATTARSPG